ncbi:glycosyltransferase, partial [Faecalibaculum rodentium]
ILLLAGAGELEAEIRDKVKTLGLEDSVKFLGLRKDIPALMNAMDVFVLPSFFEGLPVVGVEAQATGLPVITSTAVARELPLEDLAQYIPLESSPEIWAEAILKAANESRAHRRDTSGDIAKAGYEIKAAARDFEQFYLARAAEAGIRSDNSKAGQPSSASDEKGTEA